MSAVSSWVSAHAGTGKTQALINRLLQLLVEGVAPERIVCLAFTRAAAAEMAERLHTELQEWAFLPTTVLKQRLQTLKKPTDTHIQRARGLFAQVLETPGGLKIQTLHGFCQHLLNCFPLEAGVAPDFHVLDEHAAATLRATAQNAILENPQFQKSVSHLARQLSDQDFGRLVQEITQTTARHKTDTFSKAIAQDIPKTFLKTSAAVNTLTDAVLKKYEQLKKARGVLDYDDLILKTAALLQEKEEALWVLYKLDARIDHILVDEAQDISPSQWAVIRALADEFFTGQSARKTPRTLFVVGDEKQSIFRFQGADPEITSLVHADFEQKAADTHRPWVSKTLHTSYRSHRRILQAVDAVCTHLQLSKTPHHAARTEESGHVELWPLSPTPKDLAQRIATTIKHALHTAKIPAPKNILILVRKREPFMTPLLEALQEHNIPCSGSDRMSLKGDLAVQDLLALGRFALLPKDDFNLACVLKSPLCGMTQQDLEVLASQRTGSLWDALEGVIKNFLKSVLKRVDDQLPFEFFAQTSSLQASSLQAPSLQTPEVEEFLNLILAHEKTHIPHLQGFLQWIDSLKPDIKRDTEHHADEVRLMTVHNAKGLEADMVFLPDTCQNPALYQNRPFTLPTDTGNFIWCHGAQKTLPSVCQRPIERWKEQQQQDNDRLLYVAMTRARKYLYIGGYHKHKSLPKKCWYTTVQDALNQDFFEGAEEAKPQAKPKKTSKISTPKNKKNTLPSWIYRPAPLEPFRVIQKKHHPFN